MSKPVITKILGGYSLEWESEQIKINVSRIRENKVSTIVEIVITCTSPGLATPHIKQTSFSLTANEARPKPPDQGVYSGVRYPSAPLQTGRKTALGLLRLIW